MRQRWKRLDANYIKLKTIRIYQNQNERFWKYTACCLMRESFWIWLWIMVWSRHGSDKSKTSRCFVSSTSIVQRLTLHSKDKKTGEMQQVDAVWVHQGKKKQKIEEANDTRSGSREMVTDKPTQQALQAINKRVLGFVACPCMYQISFGLVESECLFYGYDSIRAQSWAGGQSTKELNKYILLDCTCNPTRDPEESRTRIQIDHWTINNTVLFLFLLRPY